MAERRMFSKSVIDCDMFLDMSQTARLLYYDLSMRADDDGFITPRKVMRLTGASNDDLQLLIAKKFVIPFDSGVVVIKHWKINNLIKKDRYHETEFKAEKSQLSLNGSTYEFNRLNEIFAHYEDLSEPRWNPNGTQMEPEVSIGKVSIGKDSIENTYTVDDLTPKTEPKPKPTTRKVNQPKVSSQNETAEKPIFTEFPLLGGKSVGITCEWVEEMQKLYGQGGVDVKFEIQRAKNWCINNKKYKTLWAKFLTNWFDNCVSRGGSKTGPIEDVEEESNAKKIEAAREKEKKELRDLIAKMTEGISG